MLDQRVDQSSLLQDQFLQARPGSTAKSSVSAVGSQSRIGRSLTIKGEITGSESVHIEGVVEGLIAFPGDRVTVAPSGRVSADITAQDIVVMGELVGSCDATDHLYVRHEGSLCGEIVAARISVEDGAYITGTIAIRRELATSRVTEQESAEEEFAESSRIN